MDRGSDPQLDVAGFLADHPLSEVLPTEVRAALAELAEVQNLSAGETLVAQGGPGDAGYLMVSGRLRALVDGVVVGTIGPGETVGEMALLTGDPRSATVLARRPSTVIKIGADDFLGVLADHPQTHRTLTALLVRRLDRTLTGRTLIPAFAHVIAVAATDTSASAGADAGATELIQRLSTVMTSIGVSVGATDESMADLSVLEAANDVILVESSVDGLARNRAWYDRSVVIVGSAELAGSAAGGSRGGRAAVPADATDVVVVHDDGTLLPSGTRHVLGDRNDLDHHHLRRRSSVDLARLARRLLGRERVLVLGGGGARGLAHLGTYRALAEAGIDIDAVVGVSAGAMFGAAVALDWTPDEAIQRTGKHLIDAGRLIDFTIPLVALSSGRRITERLQATYGDEVELEDLWRPLTALSADLTTLSLKLHNRGLLWRALRATIAVPGVFPPLVEGDDVLVDGGTVDNLPVGLARRLYPGATIISSDVGRRREPMTFDLPDGGIVGGWQSLWSRVRRGRRTPNVVRLLYRLTALGGGAAEHQVGDIHIEHELTGVGMFDFARSRHAIEAGYQSTKSQLAHIDLDSI